MVVHVWKLYYFVSSFFCGVQWCDEVEDMDFWGQLLHPIEIGR